jgi:hypothetical protein
MSTISNMSKITGYSIIKYVFLLLYRVLLCRVSLGRASRRQTATLVFLPSLGFPPFCLFAVVTSSKASAATRQLTLQPSRRFKARQRPTVLGTALTVHKGQTNTFASFETELHVFEFSCNIDGATEKVYKFRCGDNLSTDNS